MLVCKIYGVFVFNEILELLLGAFLFKRCAGKYVSVCMVRLGVFD